MKADAFILGVDPGLTGGLAFLRLAEKRLVCARMPTFEITQNRKKRRILDLSSLARIIGDERLLLDAAVIEEVHAMPKQGVTSSFRFGEAYGAARAIVAAHKIASHHVPPGVWKARLRVPADKDGARARASQLLPWAAHWWPLVKDDGLAEATLIALYGATCL